LIETHTEEAEMEQYEGYCVKCREKRSFDGEKKELPNGRNAAQGQCPECGTKMTRMLAKDA
jgi:Zn finger protein HypA/HybF involved in hydrogenase expression